MSEEVPYPITALELNESVRAMAQFFEDFYKGDPALKAKFRYLLSQTFADMVGETLRIARDAA